ncbi:MAG: helix-turn-helix transcriptional regulator [Gemmatimonadetes bacterium]|nr:helix-turn-helix transcriptional regulator [Gemmatimonadota bacterium]
MARESLGELEQRVLLAMLHLGGEAYSAPIVLELEQRSGRQVAPASVYIALRRMEKRGFVSSVLEEPERKIGGRGKRVFTVMPGAIEKLRVARRELERLWDGLDPVFAA